MTCFAILVGVSATAGNILVLLTIFKKPSIRSSHIFFIGSLALADFSVGLLTVPFYSVGAITWPLLLKNDHFETNSSSLSYPLFINLMISLPLYVLLNF